MDKARTGRARILRYAGITVLALSVAFFAVRGCAYLPWNRDGGVMTVRVTVTRDLGSEVLRDESIEVREGCSAMQALQEVAEVETSYGGGFIHGVDGLISGYGGEGSRQTDWFYYVNGQMAEVGAGEFEVREGDWLLFDYHSWRYSVFTPAFAGCFPEPFVRGYREPPQSCLIAYARGWGDEAEELSGMLREAGAPPCGLEELCTEWRPQEGVYTIVIGTAQELMENAFLADANRNAARLGLSVVFDGDEMVRLGSGGEVVERLPSGTGVVEAVGRRLGVKDSALMVTGTDAQGVKAALELLFSWDNTGSSPRMVIIARAGEAGP